MDTQAIWRSEFGDEYHKRNFVDWQRRIPFFKHILEITGARSVLEFGCGPGWNLSACRRAFPDVKSVGVEINDDAWWQAEAAGLNVHSDLRYHSLKELIFTVGCLIHIPPKNIDQVMGDLIERSYRYVMAVEYHADKETEIEYRGQMGLLWKRPYIEMYEEKGLTLLETGKLQDDVGFDNCTYGLLVK